MTSCDYQDDIMKPAPVSHWLILKVKQNCKTNACAAATAIRSQPYSNTSIVLHVGVKMFLVRKKGLAAQELMVCTS